ncbi:ABC transporter permease [Dyella flagellata]|nr:ABC transporter permease [Dyella flagellata]
MISALTSQRSLTIELSKRDVLGRYRGATFGLLWSLISPFLTLSIYTFAFGSILKSRWPQTSNGAASFAMILFVGLIVHGFFAECLSRSATLITDNVNFVKRVIFPLEILPWSMVAGAIFHTLMNIIVFTVLHYFLDGHVSGLVLLFPVVMVPLILLAIGIGWIFAALGVYFRDISQVTGVISTAMFFLSSAMVPVSALPAAYQPIFRLNPITFIIDQARQVALWGNFPDWLGLFEYTLVSFMIMMLGFGMFQVARRGFADVL